ncbi:MAG: single-stranded DNA-binding protein, partial [Candidatus Limnocylindrales bacterium]
DGQKRYTTELVANTITSLQPRNRDDAAGEPSGAPVTRAGAPAGQAGGDEFGSSDLDELPF